MSEDKKITLYYSSVSGNLTIKKNQQKLQMMLEGLKVTGMEEMEAMTGDGVEATVEVGKSTQTRDGKVGILQHWGKVRSATSVENLGISPGIARKGKGRDSSRKGQEKAKVGISRCGDSKVKVKGMVRIISRRELERG